jgi:HD domain
MRTLEHTFLSPRREDDDEHSQYANRLYWMLLAAVLAAMVLGLINVVEADRREVMAFVLLGAACLAGLVLNGTGRYAAAAWLFCGAVLAIVYYILFDAGGLHDTGAAAFLTFILCSTLLLATRMRAGIPYLRSAPIIPSAHHEDCDGSGYPVGLRGEAIPMAARIFTVVDHWDALRSDRRYRKAWEATKTMDYLRDNSGKLYDPRIVAEFLEVIGTGG